MIFVTVGTQLPFPRLIDAMADWAAATDERVVAQTGVAAEGDAWRGLEVHPRMTPAEFDAAFAAARVVVAHAGIGTLLSARRHRRPLVLVPRHHALGEHRNDHQLATARQLEAHPGIAIAWDIAALPGLLAVPPAPPPAAGRSSEAARLIDRIATAIRDAR